MELLSFKILSHAIRTDQSCRAYDIQIIARAGRTPEMKKELYKAIAAKIADRTSVSIDDVVIVLVENTTENWSFGQGIAQYIQ